MRTELGPIRLVEMIRALLPGAATEPLATAVSWRVTAGDGSQSEMNPRQVDVSVTRPLGEAAAGKDTQLDAAVKTLLEQIGRRATTN